MTDDESTPCACFRPDHNGECLICDEPLDVHSPAAIAAGELAACREALLLVQAQVSMLLAQLRAAEDGRTVDRLNLEAAPRALTHEQVATWLNDYAQRWTESAARDPSPAGARSTRHAAALLHRAATVVRGSM